MCELKITNSCRERSPALIGNNTNDSLMFQVQLVSWMTTDENLISIDSCLASLSCKLCQFQRKPLLDIIRPTWEWDHLPRVLEREGPAGQKLIREFVLVGTRVTVWWLLFLFAKISFTDVINFFQACLQHRKLLGSNDFVVRSSVCRRERPSRNWSLSSLDWTK